MTPPRFEAPRALFDVAHRFLDLDGARVHYVDEGAGETLLLLHGNPTWSFVYRKIIAALRSRFRCVAVDYPGYGMSDLRAGYGYTPREHSDIVERFADQLGLRDLTIVGQDWGGPIGLGLAIRRPALVRRIVLGNTFAWPLDDERRFRVFSAIMGGPIGRLGTQLGNLVPRFFFAGGFHQPLAQDVRRAYLAPWRDRSRRHPAVIAPRQLIAGREYLREVEAGLSGLADRPVLLVWGERDFAFRARERERFERTFPIHETVRLADAGHFVQEDAGEHIAREMSRWLSAHRLSPPTPTALV